MKKVILLGYMGCGKSTVAKILSKKLQLPHFELDQMIEKHANLSVKEIFEQKGEIWFRKLEHKLFNEVMNLPDDSIISLGGGTPCYANNHLLLSGEKIESFYLKASIEELFKRLTYEKSHRPLISDTKSHEMKEFIGKHLFERSFFYNYAKHKIDVNGKSPEEVSLEIEKKLI